MYTHYFNFKKDVKKSISSFNPKLIEDLRRVINDNKNIIQYEKDNDRDPELIYNGIRFNGIENDAYETFCIYLDEQDESFNFCKTARNPYDLPVCECLLLFKYYYKDNFKLDSDGYSIDRNIDIPTYDDLEENWGKALKYIEDTFNYKFKILSYINPLSRWSKNILILPEDMLKYPYNYYWGEDFPYTKLDLKNFSKSELAIFFTKNPNYLIRMNNNKIKNYIYIDDDILSNLKKIDEKYLFDIETAIKFENFIKSNDEFKDYHIRDMLGISKNYEDIKYEKEKRIKDYLNEIYKKFIEFSGISKNSIDINKLYDTHQTINSLKFRNVFKDLLDLSYWGDFEKLEKEYLINTTEIGSNWYVSGKKLTIRDIISYDYNYDYMNRGKSIEKNIRDDNKVFENILKLLSWYSEGYVATDYIFKRNYNNLCNEKYFNEDMLKTIVINSNKIKSIKLFKNSNLNIMFKKDAQEFIDFINNYKNENTINNTNCINK